MYRGKHTRKHCSISKKTALLLASLALIAGLAVGATVAYLIDDTSSVENTFQPAQVSCAIQENFDGKVKSNVYIQNTSNIDAFIRAEVVVNWVNGDGEIVPTPAGYGYELEIGADWTEQNGYYYYKSSVAADDKNASTTVDCTTDLIVSAYPTRDGIKYDPSGSDAYYLRVDILADAIQAEPASVVQTQWGYTPAG